MNVQFTAHSSGFVVHASRSWGTCSGLVRGFVLGLGNVFALVLGLGNVFAPLRFAYVPNAQLTGAIA